MTDNPVAVFTDAYDREPFGVLATLRREAAVHRVANPDDADGPSAWLITRYRDVVAALTDTRMASSASNSHGKDYLGFALPEHLQAHLLNTDPPQHTRLRGLIAPTFTARRSSELRPQVEAAVAELMHDLASVTDGAVDLVSGLAASLPARLIGDVLGLPGRARRDFQQWADDAISPPEGQRPRARDTLEQMARIIHTAMADPSSTMDDTLLARLLGAHRDERLDGSELASMVFYLLFVWYEVLVHALGSTALRALEHKRREELTAHPELMDRVIEETLRFDSPQLLAAPRFARVDIDIDGVTIGAGDTVLLSLASANRDDDVFADPDRFDPARRPNPHLSLGHGIHSCPAAALTRLILRVTTRTLLETYPGSRLTGTPEWRGNFRHRGPATVPVELRA